MLVILQRIYFHSSFEPVFKTATKYLRVNERNRSVRTIVNGRMGADKTQQTIGTVNLSNAKMSNSI